MIVEKLIECRLAGEIEVLGENLPQRHFCPSQIPTWPDQGLSPGSCGGKPATNRLSYGAASIKVTRFWVGDGNSFLARTRSVCAHQCWLPYSLLINGHRRASAHFQIAPRYRISGASPPSPNFKYTPWCLHVDNLLTYLLTYEAKPLSRSCQLCSYSQHFKESEGSSPCSQQPSTAPYPEPDRSTPYRSYLSNTHPDIVHPPTSLSP
jgi:hypothetical protein